MSFWDDRYDRPDYVFGEAPNAFLSAQAERLKPFKTALAVADGEGRNGVWMAEQGLDVLSLDASPVGLQKARNLADRRGVSLKTELCDIADYGWPDSRFDVVASIFIQFAGPSLRDAMFAGMVRTLAPGGLLLLEGYTPRQIEFGTGGPGQLENLYTEDLLREKFGALDIIELRAYEAEVDEGAGHKGMSALIDLVARKPA